MGTQGTKPTIWSKDKAHVSLASGQIPQRKRAKRRLGRPNGGPEGLGPEVTASPSNSHFRGFTKVAVSTLRTSWDSLRDPARGCSAQSAVLERSFSSTELWAEQPLGFLRRRVQAAWFPRGTIRPYNTPRLRPAVSGPPRPSVLGHAWDCARSTRDAANETGGPMHSFHYTLGWHLLGGLAVHRPRSRATP